MITWTNSSTGIWIITTPVGACIIKNSSFTSNLNETPTDFYTLYVPQVDGSVYNDTQRSLDDAQTSYITKATQMLASLYSITLQANVLDITEPTDQEFVAIQFSTGSNNVSFAAGIWDHGSQTVVTIAQTVPAAEIVAWAGLPNI